MANLQSTNHIDVYQTVTNRILQALDRGVAPWIKPWDSTRDDGMPMSEAFNAVSGKRYRGINTVLLWDTSYQSPVWATFKQWKDLGGCVRKGEKATWILFWKDYIRKDETTGEEVKIPVIRSYAVFNLDQVDGVDQSRIAGFKRHVFPTLQDRNKAIEAWFGRIGSTVRFGGNRAFYRPSEDAIQLPIPDRFRSADDFYSTGAHEHGHWTGHESRCNRTLKGWHGSPEYAFEELVAELSSAFTCARLGVRLDRLQHAEYIASWSRCLREQKTAIVKAASLAQKATDFLFGLAGELIEQEEDHREEEDSTPDPVPTPDPVVVSFRSKAAIRAKRNRESLKHVKAIIAGKIKPEPGKPRHVRFGSIREAEAAWVQSDAYREWLVIRDRKAAREAEILDAKRDQAMLLRRRAVSENDVVAALVYSDDPQRYLGRRAAERREYGPRRFNYPAGVKSGTASPLNPYAIAAE